MLAASYIKRVSRFRAIWVSHSDSGLSNREIWRRFIYPQMGISERTMYYYLAYNNKRLNIEEKLINIKEKR